MKVSHLKRALVAWRKVLGPRRVITDAAALASAESTTFQTTQRVFAILQPGDTAAVQKCMRIANRLEIPIHPVSKGRNHGYGSRVPYRAGAVLLDLGRMNRIVDFDERLSYITVEPGVTFGQVEKFLRKKKSKLYMSTPGVGALGSPLANAAERGVGRGPLFDRFQNSCAMEVVLADGKRVRTGFGRFRNGALTAKLHSTGIGPSLAGLFSQSNLGIVTQITLWLEPVPKVIDIMNINVTSTKSLEQLVDVLREIHLRRLLTGPTLAMNFYRVLSMTLQIPWRRDRRLPRGKGLDSLLKKSGLPRWRIEHVIAYESAAGCEAGRRALRKELRKTGLRVMFQTAAKLLGRQETTRDVLAPMESAFESAYWRKKFKPSGNLDLDRDRVGVIFTCPAVPAVGSHVGRAVRIIEKHASKAGLEPVMSVAVETPRIAQIIAPLFFDRDDEGEDKRARACADATLNELVAAGYLPYRGGLQTESIIMSNLNEDDSALLGDLRRALDPRGILGRKD